MHESSLFKGLLKKVSAIADENGADRVISVRVRLGALANISANHFREHWDEASAGTVAEGASLDISEATDILDQDAQHIVIESVELDVPG